MGVSTDAILFYGYCWNEEIDSLFADPDGPMDEQFPEWQEIILTKRGHVDPWKQHPERIDPNYPSLKYEQRKAAGEAWVKAHRLEIDAWREAKKAVDEEFDVLVDSHCSGECPMPFVCIPSTRTVAWRGKGKIITPDALKPPPDAGTRLNQFLEEFGIEKPQESPMWWLVSYWG